MSKIKDYIADQQAARMDALKDAKSDDVVDSEEANDYQLHLDAGLMPAGMHNDEQEWIGTDRDWRKYEELTEMVGRDKELPF